MATALGNMEVKKTDINMFEAKAWITLSCLFFFLWDDTPGELT